MDYVKGELIYEQGESEQKELKYNPDVAALAEKTENKSKFLDTSVISMRAVAMIIDQLRKREIDLETAMGEIEDYSDIWEASFEEAIDYIPLKRL